jgi:hypothetical protein
MYKKVIISLETGWVMKNKKTFLSLVLSLVLILITDSYALEVDSLQEVRSTTSIRSYAELQFMDTARTELYALKYPGVARPALQNDGRIRVNERTSAEENHLSVTSYIATQSRPPSLVGSVSHEFSVGKNKGKSSFEIKMPSTISDVFIVGAAFLTNLAAHEFGHEVVAHHVGAKESRLDFFQTRNGQFFLGTSSVKDIDDESVLPYTAGGEFFADLTFEHALKDYRKRPNLYNQSLLVSSGLDFLWYCFYAFYLSEENAEFDPVTISKETGISRDMLFSIVLAKTAINAFRVYSGKDWVVPYFAVDRNSASVNVAIPFDINHCAFIDCSPPDGSI